MRLCVRTEKHVTRDSEPTKSSRGDTTTSWEFEDAYITEDYPQNDDLWIEVGDEAAGQSEMFVVIAEWTTWDSFGVDHNSVAEIMSAHTTRENALEAERILKGVKADFCRLPNFSDRGPELPDGYRAPVYPPWGTDTPTIYVHEVAVDPAPANNAPTP